MMVVLAHIFFVYLAHFQMREMITEFPVSLHGLFFGYDASASDAIDIPGNFTLLESKTFQIYCDRGRLK